MEEIKSKPDIWLKAVLSWVLFLGAASLGVAQSEVVIAKDSIVYNLFFGETNDILYWNGKTYRCSISPLHAFAGYDSLYINEDLICSNTYESSIDDKEYIAFWTIIDDRLYLCDDIASKCGEYIFPRIEDYPAAFKENRTFDDWRLIRLMPLEALIGRKFRKILPSGIYTYPVGSGYVVAADWFNGELKVRTIGGIDPFAPYQRLTFKAGRLLSVQQLIYDDREDKKWFLQRFGRGIDDDK